MCLNLLPATQIGNIISYLFPLMFTLTLSAIKESLDEYSKYKRDKEFNNQTY